MTTDGQRTECEDRAILKQNSQLDETDVGSQLYPDHSFSHTGFRSGDEYEYEETNADGWSSDTWVRNLFDVLPSRLLLGKTFENASLFYRLPGLIPRGHLAKWGDRFQRGLW